MRLLHTLPLISSVLAQNAFDGGPFFTTLDIFPSPNTTGLGGWEAALVKADAFVSELNLTEKAYMVTGVDEACVGTIGAIPRLKFLGLCLQDGPAAIRQADLASAFPARLTAAATWDKALIYQRGLAIAKEFRGKGAHVILGPVVGPLGRHALGGRDWEGFSPDPYLTGIAAAATVEAMQSIGVQACIKHYIGNEQEKVYTFWDDTQLSFPVRSLDCAIVRVSCLLNLVCLQPPAETILVPSFLRSIEESH